MGALCDALSSRPAGRADAFDVPVVRSAAAAADVDVREAAREIAVLCTALSRFHPRGFPGRVSGGVRSRFCDYGTHMMIDYISGLCYVSSSSRMRGVSGDGPEGGAGSGVLRLRLVTAGPGS